MCIRDSILLGLIAEGNGFALIPMSLQNVKRQGVVFRALEDEFKTLSMGIAYSERNPSPALRPFLEMLREGQAT